MLLECTGPNGDESHTCTEAENQMGASEVSPDDPTVLASIELGEGSQEQVGVPSLPPPRKSTRSNVGQHSNPHHEPKSALSHSAVSQMIANLGTMFFREAVKELRNSYTVTDDVDRSAGENVTRWY